MPGVLMVLLVAAYGAPASAKSLQNVLVSRSNGVAVIEVRFNCFHRYAGPPLERSPTTFEIKGRLEAFENEKSVHKRDWQRAIKRDLV